MTVEAVEVGGGELAHITRPDQRHELADDRAVPDHRRHLEAPVGMREPRVEQLGDRVHGAPRRRKRCRGKRRTRPYSSPATSSRAHGCDVQRELGANREEQRDAGRRSPERALAAARRWRLVMMVSIAYGGLM